MSQYHIGKTVIIHKDDWAYISHPSICILQNGEWIAVFNHSRRREPRQHPPSDPLFRNLLARSSDRGATWERPSFVPDFDWYGVECPGISCLSDGTVILSQWRFAWYPLALARKRKAAGEPISIALPDRGWTEAFDEADWDRAQHPWARGYHGLYVHLSDDGGRTFEHTVQIDTSPYPGGFTRTGVVELADGRLAYALGEHPYNAHAFVVYSDDGGRSWGPAITIAETIGFAYAEPHLAEVAPGEILCILRDSGRTGYLHQCRSHDGGLTWGPVERTPMYGHPAHLLPLSDGRLLCSYGRRAAPFGIRACLSEDGGRTWRVDQEIIIRDDLPNADLGYPTTVEYEPGKLFCAYYGQEPDGVTCVQGTYLGLG
ncbi:MAG: exo-alpha-sialidase [Chloroflexi bacterium]|nr:exo-alpha-sialidase [Chloroflexota bacterium]